MSSFQGHHQAQRVYPSTPDRVSKGLHLRHLIHVRLFMEDIILIILCLAEMYVFTHHLCGRFLLAEKQRIYR